LPDLNFLNSNCCSVHALTCPVDLFVFCVWRCWMSRFPLGPLTLPLSLVGLRFAQAGAPPPVFRAFAAPHGDFSARFFLSAQFGRRPRPMLLNLMKAELEIIVSFYMKIQPNMMLQVNDMMHLGNIKNEMRHWREVFRL
jgi:hypothetical protein